MPDRCINMDKLLRAIYYIETGKLTAPEVADKIGLVPTSWYRMRMQAGSLFGLTIEKSREVGILYIKNWGVFNPYPTRLMAARLVASDKPGSWRRGINKGKGEAAA